MIEAIARHIRHSVRLLVRAPLFAATAILSLAIGLGANTAIFTVANALLLAPTKHVRDMDTLVDIGRTTGGQGFDTVSFATYADLRDRNTVFDGVYALRAAQPLSLGGDDGADRVFGEPVSASYFDVLGLVPAAGGFFHTAEEHIGVPLRKVVLSDGFWQRRFKRDPSVVGRELVLNGDSFTITGVAPAGYHGTTVLAPDLWLPLTAHARALASEETLRGRQNVWLMLGARLKPGVTRDQAQIAVSAFMRGLAAEYPDIYRDRGLVVTAASRLPGGRASVAPFLGVLMTIVGLVLLVACSNLAGLLLARATARSREVAVRLALGASRSALVTMLMAETLVLFGAGTLVAIAIARWMTSSLAAAVTTLPLPVSLELALDWRVLLFALSLALAAGLLTGLVPAWQSTRADLVPDLKMDAGAPRRQRLRRAFLVAQMAFCVILIVAAGLFLRALRSAATIDPGFRVDGIDVASIDLLLGGYTGERARAAAEELQARFTTVPGVQAVGVAAMIPLAGGGMSIGPLRRPDRSGPEDMIDADWNVVSPEFMAVVELPVVRGRGFTAADRGGAPRVAIVGERFARTVWPDGDAIGRTLEVPDEPRGQPRRVYTVVGIARDIKARWLGDSPRHLFYVPLAQEPMENVNYFLRRDDRAAVPIATPVREALKAFDRNLPLVTMTPFREYASFGLLPQRLAASIAGSLGVVALLLAAIGLYGVTAYAVASRSREIGIRMALGADGPTVVRLMLGQAWRVVAIGGAIGLAGAVALSQLLTDLLFGVSPLDPAAYGITLSVLTAVTLIATYVPARRAAQVDPLVSLRTQ